MAKLILMIGISGSGKSTIADVMAEKYDAVIHSADKIREELYSSADVQGDGRVVFGILNSRIKKSLANGENVIVDNTNTTSAARKALFKLGDVDEKIGVVIDCSVEQAMKNQEGRERKVPQDVVERQYAQLHKDKPKIETEFDLVIYPDDIIDYNKKAV